MFENSIENEPFNVASFSESLSSSLFGSHESTRTDKVLGAVISICVSIVWATRMKPMIYRERMSRVQLVLKVCDAFDKLFKELGDCMWSVKNRKKVLEDTIVCSSEVVVQLCQFFESELEFDEYIVVNFNQQIMCRVFFKRVFEFFCSIDNCVKIIRHTGCE